MSEVIRVPDIGTGEGEVIELFVKVGDRIEADQSLLTLESDKASMEIPAPKAGVITALNIKLGDKLKEGDELLVLDSGEAAAAAPTKASPAAAPTAKPEPAPAPASAAPSAVASQSQPIHVPDIGSSGKAKIIEVLVKAGDSVSAEQSLIVLESDKASMEIPCPADGVVESVAIKLDDEVGTGDLILTLKTAGAAPASSTPAPTTEPAAPSASSVSAAAPAAPAEQPAPVGAPTPGGSKAHAGPAVRKLAREMGVELSDLSGTGRHGRVVKEDVQAYVKAQLAKAKQAGSGAVSGGMGIPPIPEVDFSKFGPVEEVPMTRLMQIGAANLHRSWLNVPHVTQFDQADISSLEAFRVSQKGAAEKAGVKLTILPFLIMACARALKELPDFNSSLAPSGKALIRKGYVHIGFAVDTPDGLLVPVIRDADKKGLLQLAAEAAELADKARNKKLSPDAMQGACFTISSLGHIGGTGFTPIVNAPEVAILGVSKASMQPVWDGKAFQPHLMLPLSLSYDHRVINGASAARFTKLLGDLLGEIRTLLL